MTARRLFLVLYDVHSPKNARRIRERISAYAVGGQKSFRECLLNDRERSELMKELQDAFNPETDRLHCFQLDPRRLADAVGKTRRSSFEPFLLL